jgi:hypothetical protein
MTLLKSSEIYLVIRIIPKFLTGPGALPCCFGDPDRERDSSLELYFNEPPGNPS